MPNGPLQDKILAHPWPRPDTRGGTFLVALFSSSAVLAHAVAEGDKGNIQEITGVHLLPFMYLGAMHTATGYDHILFLFGVIFFWYRVREIAFYVTLFAVGHSTRMRLGVPLNIGINSHLIDAIIGLSVVYKAPDNLGARQRCFARARSRSPAASASTT
jgi:hypothetical protein